MLTEKRRRGPKKSDSPPLSGKERARRYRNRVKEFGGAEVKLSLNEKELEALEKIRNEWNLPASASSADVLRAVTVVLAGHTLVTTGKRISAKIKISNPPTPKVSPKTA